MSLRAEFIQLALVPDCNFSQLCRRFGISRKSGYKWLARHRKGGVEALADQSRRPRHSPACSSPAIQTAVRQVREEHPAWGGRKIRKVLELQHPTLADPIPAASTITAILRRTGLLQDKPSETASHAHQRFEKDWPNELWQMDYKGHVPMLNGQRCHPLTVLDDHSRFALGLVACGDERMATVQRALIRLFECYGMPRRILCDNGSPWGDSGDQPYTQLGVWLLRQGVAVSHGRPYHPQTQGKDERYHRTLKLELLDRVTLVDLLDAQRRFDAFREMYNLLRPHEALGLAVPASCYRVSPRAYVADPPAVAFDVGDVVRKVDEAGKISYRNEPWRIGRAFAGESVGLRAEAQQDGLFGVMFCGQRIGWLDARGDAKAMCRARPSVAALPKAGHGTGMEPVTHVSELV